MIKLTTFTQHLPSLYMPVEHIKLNGFHLWTLILEVFILY